MIKNIFRNGQVFLKARQTNILSAAFIMMMAVFLSRILGLIRDRLLAYFFSPYVLGIYFAAFRIPDMVFSILVMGALTTAFIPVIADFFTREKKEEAFYVASSVINICLIAFLIVAGVIFVFTPSLSSLVAPGFNQEELKVVSSLTRVMLLAQFFFIISNFLTGVLQAQKRFIVPSLSPIVYNLGIISGIFILSPFLGLYGPTIGVVFGAFLHFLIQIPFVKDLGFIYRFKIEISSGVKRIWRLMIPRTIGLIASQVNFTVDNILASLISPSAITIFNFASHLQQLPIGLFGATIAQAALPTLAEEKTKEDLDNFKKIFTSSLLQIIFLTLPSAVILIVLRVPLVRLFFGTIKFDWQATILTGKVLIYFSFGIIFQSLIHLFARVFYSLQNSKIPLLVGLISVFLNISLSFFGIYYLRLPIWGLAISSAIADFLNASLLFFLLEKELKENFFKKIIKEVLKIIFASFSMGAFIYLIMKIFDLFILDTTRTVNLLFLTATSLTVGFLTYFLISWALKIKELFSFKELLIKVFKSLEVIKQPSLEISPQEQISP